MEMIKKNITLVLGISIPILMILFVAGSIYLPGLFIKPHFNFLYVSGDDYYYNQQQYYSVQNGKLGWPLALVIAGLAMIGVGYMSLSLKKKYLFV